MRRVRVFDAFTYGEHDRNRRHIQRPWRLHRRPESDLNLGIVILLDGATTTTISIDMTTPGEHTILYTVTSPTTGVTGSITRTVVVSADSQPPAPQEDTTPFNAPEPQNNNASSTAVASGT